jgi:phosphatidylglycerophosphatase A
MSPLHPNPSTDAHPPRSERGWEYTLRRMVLSWFGCGLSPKAPGTLGSLGALPLGAVLHWSLGGSGMVYCAVVLFVVGWGISAAHIRDPDGEKDPQWIVIDEVAGQWLALSTVPLHPAGFLLGFVLFRLFDIVKPWPVSWADQKVGGALGIMLDDFLAGLYAAIVAIVVMAAIRSF